MDMHYFLYDDTLQFLYRISLLKEDNILTVLLSFLYYLSNYKITENGVVSLQVPVKYPLLLPVSIA